MNLEVDATTLEHAANAACRAALRAGLAEVDARDLAQDALVRALTSARPPDGVPLQAWVYGIAKNLGRDHAKSAKRREIVVEVSPDTARAEDLTTVIAVRRAVEELPMPLRDVITLHELEENSLRETAEALQIPFDTAKDRLRRAREQLRATLGDDSAIANERTHTRKRAAAYGGAIVAGLYALLGKSASATAAGLGAAGASGRAGATTGSVAALATKSTHTIPLWLAAVAGTVLVVGGFAVGRITAPVREPAAPTPAVAVVEDEPTAIETAVAQPQSVEPRVTAAAPSARAQPAAQPVATSAPAVPAQPAESGNPEQLLVERARVGLRRGMHDEALVTLMEHARRFPSGEFAEERDVLLIETYLRAGKPVVAKRRIDRYRSEHPDGVLRARVDGFAAELQP